MRVEMKLSLHTELCIKRTLQLKPPNCCSQVCSYWNATIAVTVVLDVKGSLYSTSTNSFRKHYKNGCLSMLWWAVRGYERFPRLEVGCRRLQISLPAAAETQELP